MGGRAKEGEGRLQRGRIIFPAFHLGRERCEHFGRPLLAAFLRMIGRAHSRRGPWQPSMRWWTKMTGRSSGSRRPWRIGRGLISSSD